MKFRKSSVAILILTTALTFSCQSKIPTSYTALPSLQPVIIKPTQSFTALQGTHSTPYPPPNSKIPSQKLEPIFTQSPSPVVATIDLWNTSTADRIAVILKVIEGNPKYYQDLISFCTKSFRVGPASYDSNLGYILSFYHEEQLCSMASFLPHDNLWKLNWIIPIGNTGNLQLNDISKAFFL